MAVGPYDAKFFRDMRRKKDDDLAETRASLRPHKVIVKGHEVEPEEIMATTKQGFISRVSKLGKLYNDLIADGWEVKCGKSYYYSGDKLQVNGKVIRGENKTHVWIDAVKDGKKVTHVG